MKAHNSTVYTLERLFAFNKLFYSMRKAQNVLIIALSALVIAISVLYFAFIGFDTTIAISLACIIAIDLLLAFVIFILPKFTLKKSPVLDSVNEYCFYDDRLHVTTTGSDLTGSSEIRYEKLHKVCVTGDTVYIFISSRQGFIVDKSGFDEGSAEDVVSLISGVLGAKKVKIM